MHFHTQSRETQSLSGTWSVTPDQYRVWTFADGAAPDVSQPFEEADADGPSDTAIDDGYDVTVPGTWNEQLDGFEHYEGVMWYATRLDWTPRDGRTFLSFGAVSDRATVWLNGRQLGRHEGGFTPFTFEVTDILQARSDNLLVVKVDNDRDRRMIPPAGTDWFNDGGIIRDVELVTVPERFVRNVKFETHAIDDGVEVSVTAWIDEPDATGGPAPQASLPELDRSWTLERTDAPDRSAEGLTSSEAGTRYDGSVELPREAVELWHPETPRLYDLSVACGADSLTERVGIRTLAVDGNDLLLNGEPLTLNGVSMHEEADGHGRSLTPADRARRFEQLADLEANFARLAHYPHHPGMARKADEHGVLLWAEVPAYWAVSWDDEAVRENYFQQLRELLQRDWNRPSVAFWSLANETHADEAPRNEVLSRAAERVSATDETRFVTAACFMDETDDARFVLDDPLIEHLDVVGINQYQGWYRGEADDLERLEDDSDGPPIVISEFGAGAKRGTHGPADQRWTEEFQARVYREQLAAMDDNAQIVGLSPWILNDFRSPRRQNALQRGYNLKGLCDERGRPKAAFDVLRAYYDSDDQPLDE